MKFLKSFSVVFCLMILISCSSTKDLQKNSVFVMIYDCDNTPVKEVKLTLDGKLMGTSDVNGRFIFEIHDSKIHELVLEKENYETVVDSFTYEPSLVLYYRIGNPDQYLKKAEESLDEKKYSAAFDFIQKAEAINDRREDVLFLKAVILNRLKNFAESNLVLDKIELNQRNKKFIEELRKFNENRK